MAGMGRGMGYAAQKMQGKTKETAPTVTAGEEGTVEQNAVQTEPVTTAPTAQTTTAPTVQTTDVAAVNVEDPNLSLDDLQGIEQQLTQELTVEESTVTEKIGVERIQEAFPGQVVEETEQGLKVNLENGLTINVNQVGEIEIDRESALKAGYSQSEIDEGKAVGSWTKLDHGGIIQLTEEGYSENCHMRYSTQPVTLP